MESMTEAGRGSSELERLASQWDALAAAASQLAGDHRAVQARLVRKRVKASYAEDYDRLLRQAAVVEATAAELVAKDVSHFKRVATWRQIADSLRISLSGAHLRYEVNGVRAYAKLTAAAVDFAKPPQSSDRPSVCPRPP